MDWLLSVLPVDSTAAYDTAFTMEFLTKAESGVFYYGRCAWIWNYDYWILLTLHCWIIAMVFAGWAVVTWWEAVERIRNMLKD